MPTFTRNARKQFHVGLAHACKDIAQSIGPFALSREDTRVKPQGFWPPNRDYLSLEDAVRRLSRFLLSDVIPGSPQHDALRKLQKELDPSIWNPWSVLTCFPYLDAAFFNGCLLQDVKVGWHSFDNERNMYGVTLSWYECADQTRKVWVLLNIIPIFNRTGSCDYEGYIQESWQTFVHELTVSRTRLLVAPPPQLLTR